MLRGPSQPKAEKPTHLLKASEAMFETSAPMWNGC